MYNPQAPSAGKSASKAPGKLDCRFVQDVTIFDGTQLAPGTPFTKIWRLRNNGTLKWPNQTQLVRVGGDDLGAGDAVNLEIQEEGYQVDEELDAAVDFLAPIQPGRYVSYWRLMAPSGQKFGQRVWVLIQVVPPRDEDSLPDLMDSLLTFKEVEQNNLSQGQTKQNTADVDVSSQDTSEKPCLGDNKMDLDPNEPGFLSTVTDKGKQPSPLIEVGNAFPQSQRVDVPTEVQGSSSMIFEVTPPALGAGYSSPAQSVPLPVLDLSRGHIAVSASAPSLVGSETFFVGKETEDRNAVEQTLLHELEDMGFNQTMLNAELLRKHNYDLQKTLDDLCSASEWDPILEELQEMGFHDSEMNRTLLVKNEGSVKRVVLDLLSAEKDASSMQPTLSKKAKQS
jgi:next-to-BRCA1 protein 1